MALLLLSACARVRLGSEQDGQADSHLPGDAGPRDATADRADFGTTTPLIDLELLWASAHSLNWGWQCSGLIPSFDRYEFCIGTDPVAVAARKARCMTPADDFALGLPDCVASGLWHPVTVYDLQPSSRYYAQLWVFGQDGKTYGTPLMSAQTTAEPASRVWLFDDDVLSGVWLINLARTQTRPHSGTWALVADLADTAYYNLHYGGMTLAYPGLTDQRLQSGHLELYIDAPRAVSLCLSLVGEGDFASYCAPRGFASVDARRGYQRVEVPLRLFRWNRADALMTAATLPRGTKLQVGSRWGKGQVLLDEISIRY